MGSLCDYNEDLDTDWIIIPQNSSVIELFNKKALNDYDGTKQSGQVNETANSCRGWRGEEGVTAQAVVR